MATLPPCCVRAKVIVPGYLKIMVVQVERYKNQWLSGIRRAFLILFYVLG